MLTLLERPRQAEKRLRLVTARAQIQKQNESPIVHSCQIAVRGGVAIDPLQIFPHQKVLDPLLDHRDLGLEATGELADNLAGKLRVAQFFALPAPCVS